ncbi:MAG TPA: ribose 5-phosphate isomerase B [Acidimicrobiia bacterium]|nr:ribose 5-phosphate isomerase B [Acidimicrobiia bacterium]
MTARDPNIEADVRAMVQRIVDGLVGTDDGGSLEVVSDDPSPSETVQARPETVAGPAEGIIAIGADHGGFALKERLGFRLKEQGHTVVDCGTHSSDPVDYPDIAQSVARLVSGGEADVGIVVDGAGIGSAMVANKVPGVRAALCYDISTARNAREHNHANVLTLGAGLTGDALAWQITEEFLATPFGSGRHARRVAMIDALDTQAPERVG